MTNHIKLFTCGPVQMYSTVATIRDKGFIHFRTSEFSNLVKTNLTRLAELIGAIDYKHLIYLACSGTGAMEATVENCISQKDKCLVVNGGGFGKRFCELLKYHNKYCKSIDIKWNETLTQEHLKPYENKGYTTLFVNLHETTSGQLYDIKMLSDFCKRNNMYLIVDAISTFLADNFNMGKYNIDATIISSQKGLSCSPGMSILAFSQRMINKINKLPSSSSKYFDYKDYLVNIPRGQTPYTPPVLVMYEIQEMLNLIEEKGGKESWLQSIEEKANYFRKRANDIGLKIPNYPLSNMLTPIFFENIDAYEFIQLLKDKYRIYVNPCGGALATKLLRVSHIGNTTIEDIDYLLEKIQLIINEIKNQGVSV